MGTEEQSENGGGVATASDSLTITDNRTGQDLRGPDQRRHRPRDGACARSRSTTTTSA